MIDGREDRHVVAKPIRHEMVSIRLLDANVELIPEVAVADVNLVGRNPDNGTSIHGQSYVTQPRRKLIRTIFIMELRDLKCQLARFDNVVVKLIPC